MLAVFKNHNTYWRKFNGNPVTIIITRKGTLIFSTISKYITIGKETGFFAHTNLTMDSDDNEEGELDLNTIDTDKDLQANFHSGFVSEWENDEDGIEEENSPHGK